MAMGMVSRELLVIDARRRGVRWVSRMTEPRLQTAVSSAEVLRVISVQRLLVWMTPQWSCGLRTLQGSLKVIQGWPVSKTILSMDFQSSRAGDWRPTRFCRRRPCASYSQ